MEHIIPCSNKQWFVFKLKGEFSIHRRLIILQKWKSGRCIRYRAIWWQRLCSGEVWYGHLRSNYVQQKWGASTCTAILSRARKSMGSLLAKRGAVLEFVLSQRFLHRCFVSVPWIRLKSTPREERGFCYLVLKISWLLTCYDADTV